MMLQVTKGSNWPVVFFREIDILQPDFMMISLFDVVVIALCRMCILMFFYAFLLTEHWLPVAVTTITTTLYLVAKYMVFLSSFVVAWFEMWLVPFHVLPSERRQMIIPVENLSTLVSARNEQTDEEFRSAMEYSSAEYVDAVDRAEWKAKELLSQTGSWKILSRGSPEIRMLEGKRTYYIRDEIACSPKCLFKAVWKDNTLWNKHVAEFRVTYICFDAFFPFVQCKNAYRRAAVCVCVSVSVCLSVLTFHLETHKSYKA
ncbi:unnamed protein product [Gongylonema pulchrum]|uniref:MENTAL domain-containing protein n=1 Tax=Gongylonema pulchrum TaxID=637853 RepID=A0A183D0H4_9BILA|nr:unnamed protein product [Gongylonema pulchrum]